MPKILKEIYENDIERYINPAVAVGEMEEEFIKQEIDEYIFTNEIITELYNFLNAIINKKEGKPGIWIDGYYGSGKSHFIKYAFYCLNEKTRENAFRNFKEARFNAKDFDLTSEVTPSNIDNLYTKIEEMTLDEVMFNIDYVSSQKKDKNTITRILFNQFNKKRGYNSSNITLARLVEKRLDKEGKLEEFKERIKERFNGEEWRDEKVIDFIESGLTEVIDVVSELLDNIDKDSLYRSILNEREYSIEDLTEELKEHLDTKEDNYRLIFLLDEVSQYIGSNTSLLLNLQTILEGLGDVTKNKVWIVCTAQQDLEELRDQIDDKSVEFGKILGRFETKISLESQDATYITQKRVLEKNAKGLQALGEFYKENEEAIKNQFQFDHQLYKNYGSVDEFYLSYPFIPYQFRLISDVFKSFSNIGFVGEGIRNTERSILGITHHTAKNRKNKEIGYFISFDDYFNEQLSNNLSPNARDILGRADNIEFNSDQQTFARRVIRVLFMISNLDDSLKINFPATIENISFLLINNVKTVKSDLHKEVQSILDQLVDQNIIQHSEGTYRFLDNDGIIFANIVKSTRINPNTRATYFYNQFIKKFLSPRQDINIGNRNVNASLWIDDKQETRTADFTIRFVTFDLADLNQRAMNIPSSELNINISEWLTGDQNFKKDFMEYCKTAEAIRENRPDATGDRVKTIEEFAQDNLKRIKDLQMRFEKQFRLTSYTSRQQVISADKISASQPKARYDEMVESHIKQLYRNHDWSNNYPKSSTELKESINTALMKPSIKEELNLAEKEIDAKILQAGGEMNLSEIVKMFEKPPYGWKDTATLKIVFDIVNKQHRRFVSYNEELALKDYFKKANNVSMRSSIEIKPVKEYNQEEIDNFCAATQTIFPDYSLPNNREVSNLIEDFKYFLGSQLSKANTAKDDYPGYPFSPKLKDYHSNLAAIYQIKSVDRFMTSVTKQQKELKEQRDFFMGIMDFVDNNLNRYEGLKDYITNESLNLSNLEEALQDDVKKIEVYLKEETEPALHFPAMLKLERGIKKAVRERLKELKDDVVQQYKEIFVELKEMQKELSLEDSNILPDESYYIEKLEKSKSLNELILKEAKSTEFKRDYLFKLQQEAQRMKAAEGGGGKYEKGLVEYSLSTKSLGKTLSTADEIENFIEDLRKDLMAKLEENEGGKIFLN